jgi:hypothetical protein
VFLTQTSTCRRGGPLLGLCDRIIIVFCHHSAVKTDVDNVTFDSAMLQFVGIGECYRSHALRIILRAFGYTVRFAEVVEHFLLSEFQVSRFSNILERRGQVIEIDRSFARSFFFEIALIKRLELGCKEQADSKCFVSS